MSEIKVKAHGQKIKLRKMEADEVITKRTVYCNSDIIEKYASCHYDVGSALFGSYCIGEKVSEHPDRHYYEVLSDFYTI